MSRPRLYKEKAWLEKQYLENELSMPQMAEMAQCALITICRWMRKYGIQRRTNRDAQFAQFASKNPGLRFLGNRDWMEKRYIRENLTLEEIAKATGTSKQTVLNYLERLEIKPRSQSRARLLAWGKGRYGSSEYIKKTSRARRAYWERNPEARRKMSERNRRFWSEGCFDKMVETRRSEEWRSEQSRIMKEKWIAGEFDNVFTKPTTLEIALQKALNQLKITHHSQYRPKGCSYVFDEFLPPDILVEANGDYWHGLDRMVERDKLKGEWAETFGFRLVVIWESEAKERGMFAVVVEKILPLLDPGLRVGVYEQRKLL